MRKLPPTGTRHTWGELAAARETPGAQDALRAALGELIPCRDVQLFGSGRAALTALLRALRRLREGDRVIVPAYTCWTVPAAIVRAGLRVLPVDVKPGEIDYDFERLREVDTSGVLAVLSPNLFGLPGDLNQLANFADDRGIALIDDAAQCLGAQFDGRAVGGFGMAGIVSFGRGKNVSALGGGAALVRDEDLAAALGEIADEWRGQPAPSGIEVTVKGALMRLALSPNVFGYAEKMPTVTVGKTVFEPEFPTAAMGAARAGLAARVLARLGELNQHRANVVAWIDRTIAGQAGVVLPRSRAGARPAWLRRPLLTMDSTKRDALLGALQAVGIGATGMYPAPVHRIEALAPDLDLRGAPFAGAERLAASLVALPLAEGTTEDDLERLRRAVVDTTTRRTGQRWA